MKIPNESDPVRILTIPIDAQPSVDPPPPPKPAHPAVSNKQNATSKEEKKLTEKETEDVAEEAIESIDRTLDDPDEQHRLGNSIDGRDSSERTEEEQENVDDTVEEIVEDEVIGGLDIVVADEGDDIIPEGEDAVLVGGPDDATLVVREGLTATEVSDVVQEAATALTIEVAKKHGVKTNISTLLNYFRAVIRPKILSISSSRTVTKLMERDGKEAIRNENLRNNDVPFVLGRSGRS